MRVQASIQVDEPFGRMAQCALAALAKNGLLSQRKCRVESVVETKNIGEISHSSMAPGDCPSTTAAPAPTATNSESVERCQV